MDPGISILACHSKDLNLYQKWIEAYTKKEKLYLKWKHKGYTRNTVIYYTYKDIHSTNNRSTKSISFKRNFLLILKLDKWSLHMYVYLDFWLNCLARVIMDMLLGKLEDDFNSVTQY